MGYHIHQRGGSFRLRREHHERALKAIWRLDKRLLGGRDAANRGSTLVEALADWLWQADVDPDTGDIIRLEFTGDKSHDERRLFEVIAPYVEAGSFIEMAGDGDCHWRWLFEGKIVREQIGEVVYQEGDPAPTVHIGVRGGVAYVESAPADISVEIADYDNLVRA
jgi:hypothetical protein